MIKLTTDKLIKELENISGKDISEEVMKEIEFNQDYDAYYVKGKDFKGYNVYVPEFKKNVTIGYPYVIFAKNGEVRVSTDDESIEYHNYTLDELKD